MARRTLTDKGVAVLKPRANRYAFPDPELRGHYVRVTPSGAKSFTAVARAPNGKQLWTTIGNTDALTIETARHRARTILDRVRGGLSAVEPQGETFGVVTDNWLKRHVEKNELRSRFEIERLLNRHILPAWRDCDIVTIRRSNITALLDIVEDEHGARQADYCLNVTRSIMNWYAARHDEYSPPIVRGMRRQSIHAQARTRVLADDEIRAIWRAAETTNGAFGAFVRIALLTAQRREKVRSMRWVDISEAGEWTIPRLPREKETGGVLALPAVALAIIEAQPRLGENPFVFTGRGDGPFNGFSKSKERLDGLLPNGTPAWTIHDLRRTARSLMSRAGVSSDHAERVMGHAIGGVEGVYDRHVYKDEKADALRRLASLIDSILNPRGDVVPLRRRG